MKLEEIKTITVLGAGIMGHGIAQSFLMGGYPVRLYDIKERILETAKTHIQKNLELFCRSGLLQKQDIEPSLNRLSTTVDLKQAAEESNFIVEAAPEKLSLKRELFRQVESLCRRDTIIASNTSSLTLGDIGLRVRQKERLIITHWFNPPHIVPTVEVVKSEWTSDATMDATYELLAKIKKIPVRINQELPGFIVNRIQIALAREVLDLYEKGVASAEDIDKAVRGSIGFRLASIGPLLTMDFGGINLWLAVYKNLISDIQSSMDPPEALKHLASQGHDGIKSGKGFYDYRIDFSQEDLDRAIQKRDREFLNRLKNLYWDNKEV
jgi:3-hydroxybutyryl-CoA dehydrogenase